MSKHCKLLPFTVHPLHDYSGSYPGSRAVFPLEHMQMEDMCEFACAAVKASEGASMVVGGSSTGVMQFTVASTWGSGLQHWGHRVCRTLA